MERCWNKEEEEYSDSGARCLFLISQSNKYDEKGDFGLTWSRYFGNRTLGGRVLFTRVARQVGDQAKEG